MFFDRVIGQSAIKERLLADLRGGRVPHALMLCGPAGSGKLALAVAFAQTLLCQQPGDDGSACGDCISCRMAAKLEHPDLHFTFPVIKPANSSADYKPISDDFSNEWHELLAKGPYFTIEQWLEAIGTTSQQAIMTVKEADTVSHKLSLRSSQGGYKVSLVWLPERMR